MATQFKKQCARRNPLHHQSKKGTNPLLDHINIIITSRRRSRRSNLLRFLRDSLLISSPSPSITITSEVIIHLLVEFFLCLAGSGAAALSSVSVIVATRASPPAVSIPAYWRSLALSWDVSIDVIRGWFGDVASTGSLTTATTALITAAAIVGAIAFWTQTAGIPGTFDTVQKAALGSLDLVEWVAVPSASSTRNDCQPDRLAFGVRAIEFIDCGFGIVETVIGNIGDTFGASSAIVDQGNVENWSNLGE